MKTYKSFIFSDFRHKPGNICGFLVHYAMFRLVIQCLAFFFSILKSVFIRTITCNKPEYFDKSFQLLFSFSLISFTFLKHYFFLALDNSDLAAVKNTRIIFEFDAYSTENMKYLTIEKNARSEIINCANIIR